MNKTPKDLGYKMPAEWEKQEAIWLTWPKNIETWEDIKDIQKTYLQIIEIITSYEKVNLLVDNLETQNFISKTISSKNLEFFQIPTVDSWIRDYGPTFVINNDKLAMINWTFNAWGNKYEELAKDDCVPLMINKKLNLPIFTPNIVLEGGSIDVNGKGTVLVTKQCLLNPNRNPSLSKTDIEQVLKDYLNVEKIIWLNSGIIGDDTDGHVDDITRFISEDIIVTAITENTDPNYQALEENYKILKNLSNKPFSIVKLPIPKKNYNKNLPKSYCNFLITNNCVLVPIYDDENDKKALSILKELFTNRDVIGINSEKNNIWLRLYSLPKPTTTIC